MLTPSATRCQRLHSFCVERLIDENKEKKNQTECEQHVVLGQGSQPDNASSPQRHAPLEVKQQGLSSDRPNMR